MAAANTDLFRKVARRWVAQVGAGGISDDTTTTGPLSTTTGLPTDTAVDITIDRVDTDGNATSSLEETVTGVVSGSNLANMVRGQEGTAQAHNASKVAENLWSAITWNDAVDGILQDHDQAGQHKNLTDANGNEWIKQTATSSAVNELTVANAATGNNPVISATGDDTNIGIELTPKGTGVVDAKVGLKIAGSTVTADDILDEDTLVSDSATALATQQSIKKYVDDAISGASGGTDYSAKGTKTGTQSLSNTTFTKVNFDSEAFDTDTIHDNSTNNTRLTCKTAGKYFITGNIGISGNSGGSQRRVDLMLNNSAIEVVVNGVPGTNNVYLSVSSIRALAVNDYVEIRAYQDSGSTLNILGDSTLAMAKVLG